MAATTATATAEVSDVPVTSLINKRLRALRKKLNRIIQMEDAISNGKPINKEQEEVLRSKPAVVAIIDELEKLRQPLSDAVAEELSAPAAVEDLLSLLYFGSLFDVKPQSDFTATMLTRTHERGCCLTYDYVTDDATDLLREADLDSISRLGGLMISRPVDSSLSHKDALLKCLDQARLWLARSDELVDPSSNITYSGLRERLDKIIASDYMTTTPEMKAPVEVAAAAAAGNYAPFEVPLQSSVAPAPVPVQVEVDTSALQFQQDEGTTEFEGHESSENQSSVVEEFHQEEQPEAEHPHPLEPVPVEQEQTRPEAEVEYGQRDFESEDQHYAPRRPPYQSQRGGGGRGGPGGGGRRGYPTGRGSRGSSRGGGGPYQNGRYYDQQPGGYYPRNNYYSNRGRGGRGGGPAYNNHDSAVQGGQVSTSVGVGS